MVLSNALSAADLEAQIDRAERAAQLADAGEPRAQAAHYDRDTDRVVIQLRDGSVFMFPSRLGQGLAGAAAADLARVEVTPSGIGLHWERLDVDLQVPSLLRGIYGTQAWMARLRGDVG
ncbi:DUF2442 domain-containing protein [Prochlorothrix hollandica]|uniref:DUF2442 domain-containing protein n=1 Tax=Prochlorothrix hollandica TaxID=1223 RepID=UPI00333F3A0C